MSEASGFESWGVQGSPITVEYSLVVLEEIRQEVARGLQGFARGGLSVGGVLYGTHETHKIRIQAIRSIECDHASGPSFHLSEQDHKDLERQLATEADDTHLRGMVRLGWFVSHPKGELSMSADEVSFFERYFLESWQVTLLVQPGRGQAMRAAFFVREPDGSLRADQSYQEFAFPDRLAALIDPSTLKSRELARTRERRHSYAEVVPVPAVAHTAAPITPIFGQSPYAANSGSAYPSAMAPRRWWPWVLGGVAILALAGIIAYRYLREANRPEPVSLVLIDNQGKLQVQWSTTSNTIVRSVSGSLDINDNGRDQHIPLTHTQLGEGRYEYERQGGDVEVRMEVDVNGGAPVRESSRFLGRPPAPETNLELEQVKQQRDKLQADVDRLKQENSVLNERLRGLEVTQRILESRLGITR
jgi:hypothetical protein